MLEKIKSTLNFIVWENFTDPMVYFLWIKSLVYIFLFWFVSLVLSSLIVNKSVKFNSKIEEFVLRSALGISISSFLLSFLGLTYLLYAWSYFGIILFILAYLGVKNKFVFLETFQLFVEMFKKYYPFWILFLLPSIASLLPPRWFDETSYHLVYPIKWVREAHVFADGSMKFPLYTFNFHMLHSIGIFLDSFEFSHLLSWISAILASFGVYALSKRFELWKPLHSISALAFFLSPIVAQYMNRGFHDVPLMFYLLAFTYTLILIRDAENKDNQRVWIMAAFVSAMFVGMKTSNAFFVPFIYLAAIYRQNLKKTVPFLILFSILGGFWYLRNIIINGDPIPPSLNILLGKEDMFWSKSDYYGQMFDLKRGYEWGGWRFLYKFPKEVLIAGADSPLRYWPLLGYILVFPFSLVFFKKIKANVSLQIITFFAFFGIISWLYVSYIVRYAHFIALSIFLAAFVVNEIYLKLKDKSFIPKQNLVLVFLAIFLIIGPLPSAYSYYKSHFSERIPTTQAEFYDFISWREKPQAIWIIDNLHTFGAKKGDNIYLIRETRYKYYFEKKDYHVIGDDFNKFRFADFKKAIKQGYVKQFLDSANVHFLLFVKPEMKIDSTFAQKHNLKFKYSDGSNFLFENTKP